MTRQQTVRSLIAVSAAVALAMLVGCARHAASNPAPDPAPDLVGEEKVTPSPAPRKPVPREELVFKPPVDTPEAKPEEPAPKPPMPTPEDKPVTRPDSQDKEPAPPAQKLEDVLQYVGAFRVPGGKQGDSEFNFGGTALAFNPANKSLFLVGHDHQQAIGEVKIPDAVVNSKRLEDLPTAKVLQPPTKVLDRIPNFTLEGTVKIGGLMVVDGRLIGTAYIYYDAGIKGKDSHFRLDSLELSSAKVAGLFPVGDAGGGLVGGYMAPVPAEWQKPLGARYVTGQAAIPIISRTSSGPAAFGFDPKDLGRETASVPPLVYYPLKHPLAEPTGRDPNFNITAGINGVFFVPKSRTVLFFGSQGTGEVCYGEAAEFNDGARTSKGWHSRDGKYEYQVWAYDVLDLVAVKEGKKQPWAIKPYAVWHFQLPIDVPQKYIGGVAFDPQTARLYVSQLGGDHKGYDFLPLIHVFKVSGKRK